MLTGMVWFLRHTIANSHSLSLDSKELLMLGMKQKDIVGFSKRKGKNAALRNHLFQTRPTWSFLWCNEHIYSPTNNTSISITNTGESTENRHEPHLYIENVLSQFTTFCGKNQIKEYILSYGSIHAASGNSHHPSTRTLIVWLRGGLSNLVL